MLTSLNAANTAITLCSRCPRLRKHCKEVAIKKRKAFANETYWGKPVPGFGDPKAKLLVVGLAPAAHGANRTGRIFTGDQSGLWLYRALHKAGFANQPTSTHREDGLKLKNAYVTCIVRCAPPDNKPTPTESKRCALYLRSELQLLENITTYLVLGGFALKHLWKLIGSGPQPKFKHGAEIKLASGNRLLMSYHPSQQNTFTKRLTEPMFDAVFQRARNYLSTIGVIGTTLK